MATLTIHVGRANVDIQTSKVGNCVQYYYSRCAIKPLRKLNVVGIICMLFMYGYTSLVQPTIGVGFECVRCIGGVHPSDEALYLQVSWDLSTMLILSHSY